MSITRRGFINGLGASLLAAPFTRILTGQAQAQMPGRARRLVVFTSPNGCIHNRWRPAGGERDFVLRPGSVLEPLADWRDRLLIVDGLNFLTGNNHEGGQAAMLTNGGGAGTQTRGMSLDQFVAGQIGAQDRFSSLEFGVLTDIWGANQQTRVSYRGPGELVHPDSDPRRAFGRMFGDLAGGVDAQARLRLLRRSVLDAQRAELADLRRRVGRTEQIKLEAHLDAVRSVEQSLFSDVVCGAPNAPDALNKDVNDNVPALLSAQIDLAVTALACGMTHVTSIQLSHTVSPVVYTWAGNQDGHHSLSHADDGQVAKVQAFVDAERWIAGQFAQLLDRLAATDDPEGDGSLLDSTVVMWAKEMGDPRAHVCEAVPFVLAGAVDGGRYLRVNGDSHSKLLVSVARMFGADIDTFGDPTTAQGGLAGVM
ncbi:MAG: hypothetical protein ACI9U2_003063 [Bradymonadia bacterium]